MAPNQQDVFPTKSENPSAPKSQSSVLEYLEAAAKASGITDLSDPALADILSEKDPLKHVRDEFHYPKCTTLPEADESYCDLSSDSIYLCGNSLGLMPKATKEIMLEHMDKWADMGVFGHFHGKLPWIHSDESTVTGISKLVGAKPEEVAMCNDLTVNIHMLLTAFYKPTDKRHKILIESKAFPSDYYAVESQIKLNGRSVEESLVALEPTQGEENLRLEDILDYIEKHGHDVSGVVWSVVDLAHAFCNVPLHLHRWNVDFAAWCSYKYGSTSAGGLAGLFVHEKFKSDGRNRMVGWWAHRGNTRFRMDNVLELDDGASGYRISCPSIHQVVPVIGMLKVFNKLSMEDLRQKSKYLAGYLEFLITHFFGRDSVHRF